MNWHIVTGEYPPQPGGVSDYTRVIAKGLIAAGDTVQVWAPGTEASECTNRGVVVHRLSGRFGLDALRHLDAELISGTPGKLLLQYVPQAFGWKGMNVPFCLWLYARRKLAPIVMFHEVMYPIERGASLRYKVLGGVSMLMASLVARASKQMFVSTPIWQDVLRTWITSERPSEWLPLPTTIPVIEDNPAIAQVRQRYLSEDGVVIGHFSSYPESTRNALRAILPALQANPRLALMLIGAAGPGFRTDLLTSAPSLKSRIHATGPLSPEAVSIYLSACDMMLQPYPDGACARRTTLVAALAHGRAIVSNIGPATESFWPTSGSLALAEESNAEALLKPLNEMIARPDLRARYGLAATRLYRDRFDLSHTIRILRKAGCESQ